MMMIDDKKEDDKEDHSLKGYIWQANDDVREQRLWRERKRDDIGKVINAIERE